MANEPYPKSRQLARGEKRYRRKVASPKQWQAIRAEKLGPCRVCEVKEANPYVAIHLHHLVSRGALGDDVAANLAPLCSDCHGLVEGRDPHALAVLAEGLEDAEYAYVVGKLGENALERLFGV